MIEKPVAYIKPNVDGKLITITKEHLDACKDGWAYIKFEWEKAEPLFTESQLKAERERAIEMQLKINKELAETVTKLELEIARFISS
jgi:DNA mismatch repair ATPase MutS